MRAVVQEIIPRDFWGSKANSDLILGCTSSLRSLSVSPTHSLLSDMTSFLRMRRWETFTLHTVLQKFSVESCDWLLLESSSKPSNIHQKPNAVEMSKRREILGEFLYWFFDSFVMDIAKVSFSLLFLGVVLIESGDRLHSRLLNQRPIGTARCSFDRMTGT